MQSNFYMTLYLVYAYDCQHHSQHYINRGHFNKHHFLIWNNNPIFLKFDFIMLFNSFYYFSLPDLKVSLNFWENAIQLLDDLVFSLCIWLPAPFTTLFHRDVKSGGVVLDPHHPLQKSIYNLYYQGDKKRYIMIDQQIEQYSEFLSTPLPIYATQIIVPFLTFKFSANQDKGFGFWLIGESLYYPLVYLESL